MVLIEAGSGDLKRLIAPLNPPQGGSGPAKAERKMC